MLILKNSNRFRKDLKNVKSSGRSDEFFLFVIKMLLHEEKLPAKCRVHKLSGNWKGYYECHIAPDWLLIYRYAEDNKLFLARTGSHSELFG